MFAFTLMPKDLCPCAGRRGRSSNKEGRPSVDWCLYKKKKLAKITPKNFFRNKIEK